MTAQAWVALVLGLPLVVAFITWRQRNANDARDQWWKRTTWAVDKSLDHEQEVRTSEPQRSPRSTRNALGEVSTGGFPKISRVSFSTTTPLDNRPLAATMGTLLKEMTRDDHRRQV
ncbi:hypothetical protein [Rhodococcus sp. IEGM 1408]|uniref:hypothetical protein n=1 Tax=Rhodococcus sp. IEGM 1408 TaxID=3082220 RepID=UPI002953675C|nr:hypothetical protein [Rhodococcus sp. IEGM 1408]MDV7999633.1 hypothetical protein [Rhodococcus sp. IEGM 1408]